MMKPCGSSSWPLLAWGNHQHKILSVSRRGNTGILAVPSPALVLFASPSSPPAVPITSIMEAPVMLENGNAPKSTRSKCLRVAFYALIFVLIIISALVSIVFCLLHHQQAPQGSCWAHGSFSSVKVSYTKEKGEMSWNWKLEHCDGIVQDQGRYLIIQQSGNYFIYAQLYRKKTVKAPFTLMLVKHPNVTLNNSVGHENGTVNFARPFSLQKGDKLYCNKNDDEDNIVLEKQTYWGLFQM